MLALETYFLSTYTVRGVFKGVVGRAWLWDVNPRISKLSAIPKSNSDGKFITVYFIILVIKMSDTGSLQ